MRTATIQRLGGVTLAALLLVPALPAAAREGTTGIELDLAAALDAQGSTFGLEPGPRYAAAMMEPAAELSGAALRAEAWSMQEQNPPAQAMEPEKKSFGRWLKKHWYVPVLAAAVLGVAIDAGGDDDSTGEDD